MSSSNQQILEKAIHKAIDGGWKPRKSNSAWDWCDGEGCLVHDGPTLWNAGNEEDTPHPNDIIFNHGFAKALWTDADIAPMPNGTCLYQTAADGVGDKYYLPSWQYHLQQMVIAADPVAYLGEHI